MIQGPEGEPNHKPDDSDQRLSARIAELAFQTKIPFLGPIELLAELNSSGEPWTPKQHLEVLTKILHQSINSANAYRCW